jgi:hypothetical protein
LMSAPISAGHAVRESMEPPGGGKGGKGRERKEPG